jgi:NAD(P) transhydrogenase subunit beta
MMNHFSQCLASTENVVGEAVSKGLHPDIYAAVYLVAALLFIFGLKGLSSPRSALRGNFMAMIGMLLAVIITLMHPSVTGYTWIFAGLGLGALVGSVLALRIQMTSMPELVAILHSFVGLSAVLVAIGIFIKDLALHGSDHLSSVFIVEVALGSAIGAVTFTGSVVAFGKLKGVISGKPLVFACQHYLNLALGIVVVVLSVVCVNAPSLSTLVLLTVISLALGYLIVVPIGGADMPVIVSMLNSYSGWAAAATGFTLGNHLLIATGALVGSSGAILSFIMCKAMNRSFFSVVLGGFGGETTDDGGAGDHEQKPFNSSGPEDAGFMMENATKVIIVPGYGMAVAHAQHAIKELFDTLKKMDIEVKFAIHPVAGRMPGHMNVLLAEADIPYDVVAELEEINNEFATAQVALVVGANDILNPAAKTDKDSPLYGMPILDAYKAGQVFVCKRSMSSGYAGVDNDLFYYDNCSLIFGDAKETCEALVEALKSSK